MDSKTVVRELAEEIRTNTRLRHRLGLTEGDSSGVVESDEVDGIQVTTTDGEQFVLGVSPVED